MEIKFETSNLKNEDENLIRFCMDKGDLSLKSLIREPLGKWLTDIKSKFKDGDLCPKCQQTMTSMPRAIAFAHKLVENEFSTREGDIFQICLNCRDCRVTREPA